MAMPLPNGKLAMWLFLVTEIMFFTALIGTYLILRSSVPTTPSSAGPSPTTSTSSSGWARSTRSS